MTKGATNLKLRTLAVALSTAFIVLALSLVGSPAMAGPRHCVTYDFAGNELCVSENGLEGGDYFVPGETTWTCVIYTFSGAEICVSNDGQIRNH